MRTDTTPEVNITYGQLESLLIKIGYSRVATNAYRAFKQHATDTVLLFPPSSDEERVPFHQVQMARVNSVSRGVITENEFDNQLFAVAREKIAVLA